MSDRHDDEHPGRPEDQVRPASESSGGGEASPLPCDDRANEFPPPDGPLRSPALPPVDLNYAPPTPDSGRYLPDAEWTAGQIAAVFFAGLAAAFVAGGVAFGLGADADSGYVVFGVIFPAQVLGTLVTAGSLSARRGTGNWARDFGLRLRIGEIWGLGGGVGLQVLALIVTGIVLMALGGDTRPEQNVADVAEASVGGALVLAFVGTVLLAPLVEEVLYRGMLLSWLRRRMGRHGSVIVSAAIFAGVHLVDPGTLLLLPGLFVIGVGLGYAALRSGGLSLPLYLHAGVNLTGFALTQFADELQRWAEDLETSVKLVVSLVG